MTTSPDTIAALFVEAQTRARQFEAAADLAPATAQEAYRVQDLVFAALYPGQRAGAWKVGGPRPDIEPTAAPIPAARLYASPARVPAQGFHMIGIEVELAFRLGRDLPPRAAPNREEVPSAATQRREECRRRRHRTRGA